MAKRSKLQRFETVVLMIACRKLRQTVAKHQNAITDLGTIDKLWYRIMLPYAYAKVWKKIPSTKGITVSEWRQREAQSNG
jgi:hypothetical protein